MSRPEGNSNRRRNAPLIAVFVFLLLLFAFVLHYIFSLRLEYGDTFPNYSSYRADPMGAQALYEALMALPGITVTRNEKEITGIEARPDTTLILAGVLDTDDPKEVIDSVERVAKNGGRLLVTYVPRSGHDWDQAQEQKKRAKERKQEKEAKEGKEEEDDSSDSGKPCKYGDCPTNITKVWGFEIEGKKLPGEKNGDSLGVVQAHRKNAGAPLPDNLSWRSASYFVKLDKEWNVIYVRNGDIPQGAQSPEELPVVIERKMGKGTIAICSDSYFLSNEAMRKHRAPEFLSWFLGPNKHIIFDESHNGISHDVGVIDLIKRYRMVGVLLAGVLTALIFIWRSASTLTPRHDAAYEESSAAEETGRDALAGLNNLVRRSVPPARLLEECYLAWRQDLGRDRRFPEDKLAAVEAVARDASGNTPSLVARYRLISKLLKERI